MARSIQLRPETTTQPPDTLRCIPTRPAAITLRYTIPQSASWPSLIPRRIGIAVDTNPRTAAHTPNFWLLCDRAPPNIEPVPGHQLPKSTTRTSSLSGAARGAALRVLYLLRTDVAPAKSEGIKGAWPHYKDYRTARPSRRSSSSDWRQWAPKSKCSHTIFRSARLTMPSLSTYARGSNPEFPSRLVSSEQSPSQRD
jgi:hypothetical protein